MHIDKLSENIRIVWTIAAKDIADALKNRTILSVILGISLMMLTSQALPLLLGLQNKHRLLLYNASDSALVGEAAIELRQAEDADLDVAPSQQDLETSLGEASDEMLGVVIPADFDKILDTEDKVELDGYYVHWVSPDEVAAEQAFFEERLADLFGKPVRINVTGHAIYPGPDSDGQPFMTSMCLVIAIISISAFIVPYLMIEEKETHTMDALLVSPASISQVVTGKALAGLVYGLAAAGVVLAFNRAFVVHWWLAILAAVCGTLFAVTVGLLMGSLFDNPQSMSLWLSLVLVALLMPVFLVNLASSSWPGILRTLMPWVPSVTLAKVFRISLSGNVSLDQIALYLGVVVGSAVLILSVVIWTVRRMDR
jgi:ABC-2 type transport system permease protein